MNNQNLEQLKERFSKVSPAMKQIYYCIQIYKDGKEHEMRIGKQLKRARDTAKIMLLNELVERVEIVQYYDGFSRKFIEMV